MRQNGVVYYLLSDHLGSTSIVANATGSRYSEQRYKAWGESRYQSLDTGGNLTPTTFRFTGQRLEIKLSGADGLYY